ncbi:MAG: Dam family site-specific DNA-(adenine-N6)-methyltransferase, partial [Gammaproteobacteria bacterium]|nr:Dam family site-specific DNA-(adenine-N6)-methyltransferase [Gammaproteobacteria bacterium]
LNKTCYNGLYRVNRSGKFNVPMGNYKNPRICDEDNLLAVSEVLDSVDLKVQSFEHIEPAENDLVYCDPPYDQTFAQYTDVGFGEDMQVRLKQACDDWISAGAHVIISNSDTDFIRRVWKGYQLHEIQAARNINCKASERNKVTELLIVGAN